MVFTWIIHKVELCLSKKKTPVFCATKHAVCTCVALKKLTSAYLPKIIGKYIRII